MDDRLQDYAVAADAKLRAEAADLADKLRRQAQDAVRVQDARDLLLETVGAALVTLLHYGGSGSVLPSALLTQINDLRLFTGRDTQTGLRGRGGHGYGGD